MENLDAHIAKLSPTARGIKNIPERVKRLEAYEYPKAQTKMDFAAIVGSDVWTQHQSNFERVQLLKRESQALATKINTEGCQCIQSTLTRQSSGMAQKHAAPYCHVKYLSIRNCG